MLHRSTLRALRYHPHLPSSQEQILEKAEFDVTYFYVNRKLPKCSLVWYLRNREFTPYHLVSSNQKSSSSILIADTLGAKRIDRF